MIEKGAEQGREEQMLEMHLARTALNDRIEHLDRLILSNLRRSGLTQSQMDWVLLLDSCDRRDDSKTPLATTNAYHLYHPYRRRTELTQLHLTN